jgi:hypothetical protein
MNPVHVSVINKSNVLGDAEILPVVAALQIQVSEHLASKWQIDAALEFVPSGKQPDTQSWRLEILDDTDFPPDSGYHNVHSDGTPYGRVFINTVRQYNENWTITASHELLEMLVNPYAMLSAYIPFDDNTGTFYNLEVCDPVSPDINGYQINGIWVSDFVLPAWFSPFVANPAPNQFVQVDYCKRLDRPAPAIVPGTTITVFGWRDLQSAAAPAQGRLGRDFATLRRRKSVTQVT